MKKKYELTNETKNFYGHILHRIRALKDFGYVKAGYLGGWVESEENLSHEGTCWVGEEAIVCGEAEVYDRAIVRGEVKVYGRAIVCGEAEVYGKAIVREEAEVYGKAIVRGEAKVYGKAIVRGEARVFGKALVCGEALVYGEAKVYGIIKVYGKASIYQGTITSTDDYICIGPIGSRNDFTTFFKDGDKIMVKCGCFRGDIEEFEKKVTETHGDSKYGKQYRIAIQSTQILHIS